LKTIAVCNQKGGVGKTTIAVLIADAAVRAGNRVLLVDLDPQANASAASGAVARAGLTLADVLIDPRGRHLRDAVRHSASGFDVAVSTVELASKERNRRMADEHDLRRLLTSVEEEYALVIVDSPPSLGVLTINALTAADEYLVVADPTRFSLDGVHGVAETAAVVRDHFNPPLALAGVVVNLVDATLESARRLAELRTRFPDTLLDPVIPRRVVVKETLAQGRSLWDAGTAKGADDVCRAIEELLEQVVTSRVG
jgi:chromosome partitioning protein